MKPSFSNGKLAARNPATTHPPAASIRKWPCSFWSFEKCADCNSLRIALLWHIALSREAAPKHRSHSAPPPHTRGTKHVVEAAHAQLRSSGFYSQSNASDACVLAHGQTCCVTKVGSNLLNAWSLRASTACTPSGGQIAHLRFRGYCASNIRTRVCWRTPCHWLGLDARNPRRGANVVSARAYSRRNQVHPCARLAVMS